MKVASFQINNYLVEAHNSLWTGVEKVFVNNRMVSRQFNWFHGIHKFTLPTADGSGQDEYQIDFRMNGSKMSMIDIDLFRNGVCLVDQSGRNGMGDVIHIPAENTRAVPVQDTLQLRELNAVPMYREEDLV